MKRIGYMMMLGLGVLVAGDDVSALENGDPARLQAHRDKATVRITNGSDVVLQYRYANVPRKPYVDELYTPNGIQILRDAPHDHLHHHGMMFAIIGNGVDFWTEGKGHGTQEHVDLKTVATDKKGESPVLELLHRLRWDSSDGSPVLNEERTVTVDPRFLGDATLVTWSSKLTPAEGTESVALTGTHYDGLGLRFVESMDGVGKFVHAAAESGTNVRGTEYVTPSRWSAYTAPANGHTVTVAIFDHPENPRHPAGMFTMTKPFAYLSATPNIWKQPSVLAKGKETKYRYAVAVWDGDTPATEIEDLYRRWLAQ